MMLLVGADSEIGAATLRHMADSGLAAQGTTRRGNRAAEGLLPLDLSQPLGDWTPPSGIWAACIFAAVPRLAACAADPAGSTFINVTQTLALTERLVDRGVYTLFLSTNQVFDGREPHMPADAPRAPVSEYGRQKAEAEAGFERLLAHGEPVAILRLSKIVSPDIALIRGWVEALNAGEPIRPFADMMMAPVETRLAVAVIAALLPARATGIFQLTGPTDVTYEAVACHIADRIGAAQTLIEAVPAASAGMPPGATPRHTTLDSRALRDRLGIVPPDPWEIIDRIIRNPRSTGL